MNAAMPPHAAPKYAVSAEAIAQLAAAQANTARRPGSLMVIKDSSLNAQMRGKDQSDIQGWGITTSLKYSRTNGTSLTWNVLPFNPSRQPESPSKSKIRR